MPYSQKELWEIADAMAAKAYADRYFSLQPLFKMLNDLPDNELVALVAAFKNGRSILLSTTKTIVFVATWVTFRHVLDSNGYGGIVSSNQEYPCFRRMVYSLCKINPETRVRALTAAKTIKSTVYPNEEPADMSCNCTNAPIEGARSNTPAFRATTVTYVTFGGIEGRNVKDLMPEEIQAALERTEAKLIALRAIPEPRSEVLNKQIGELIDARNSFVALIDEAFKE